MSPEEDSSTFLAFLTGMTYESPEGEGVVYDAEGGWATNPATAAAAAGTDS